MGDIPKTPSLDTQLANAVADVAKAQDHLAQRHFDALVAEVKKTAPRDTDWRRAALKEG